MKSTSLNAALEKAFERRASFLNHCSKEGSTAYRLFSGEKEGIPGLVIEVFAKVAVFQVHEGKCTLHDADLKSLAEWCVSELKLSSIYLKRFIPDRSHAKEDEAAKSETPYLGVKSLEEFEITEHGIKYLIRPYDGYSVGLFLDQRNNRRALADLSAGKKVLNLFSYTCGFSVACAAKGAHVTSVDVSKRYLEWGKRNFEVNALPLENHRFLAADALEGLGRLKKKDTLFDLIILDPPSFGRSSKGVFSLKRDWEKLVLSALDVVSPEGTLFFSSNLSTWDAGDFQRSVQAVVNEAGFKTTPLKIEKPLDFSFEAQGLNQICLRLK